MYDTDQGQLIHAQRFDNSSFLKKNNRFFQNIQTHLPQVSKIVSYMLTTVTSNTPNQV